LTELRFPARYEPQSRLGKGGGGEVWAVRDRHTGARYALKVLAADATEGEMAALVREAVTLSGLEGLGVPRVLRFGRLPGTGRPFMVRELVEGSSLQELLDEGAAATLCLGALVGAAEQVTVLHRAGLLHGDLKPANIIVEPGGRATLVDLGLAAPWRDRGTTAKGLTPKYAAPELFFGKPLTVRAEVYALGVALADLIEAHRGSLSAGSRPELSRIAARAMRQEPTERYPSADELASAVRRAAGLGEAHAPADAAATWPIVGIEAPSARLMQAAMELEPGQVLHVAGAPGSGRSVLLRRLAWSLGVEGRPIVYLDASLVGDEAAVRAELEDHADLAPVTILIDDAHRLGATAEVLIQRAVASGARLVVVGDGPLTRAATVFAVPELGEHVAQELVKRAVPSLTDRMLQGVVRHCGGRPGELRTFVRRVAERAVVSEEDVEGMLTGLVDPVPSRVPEDPLARASHFLDRGRYTEAQKVLSACEPHGPAAAVTRARLSLGLGDAAAARRELEAVAGQLPGADPELARAWSVYLARAHIGVGAYAEAIALLEGVPDTGALGAEALAYLGLACEYVGDARRAREVLARSIEQALANESPRVEGLAHIVEGLVHQRADRTEEARAAYVRAIAAAERAGDASTLGTAQLNLAGLLKIHGDLAGAIEHFEAAVDMGRRSGRLGTVRNALLNLANLDLYLGRLSRARANIEALEEQREALSGVGRAQLCGLIAELKARTAGPLEAARAYEECAVAYNDLGLSIDAAEATLEGVLVAARQSEVDAGELRRRIASAEANLGESSAHRSLLALARASVAWAADDETVARAELAQALSAAREAGQRDFIWRTLEARAEVEEIAGQRVRARRDREEALSVLEEIAARLPRDLREVFWNDPRRRHLRAAVERTLGSAPTEHAVFHRRDPLASPVAAVTSSISSMTSTPLERRLARILEVNTELVGEVDLDRLTGRVTDHAVDMLQAERGLVILREPDGTLRVRTSRARGGGTAEEEFSRSVAEQVMLTGEPVVSINARGDARMSSYASVHQLMLESVACVPIPARSGGAIGALYVETRLVSGDHFERELPTLSAFADQVGIAIETARLVQENRDRAEALASAHADLERAHARLQEILGDRTAELTRARQKLRDARDTLYGHFGYQGLVGTSAAMRRVYSLIERLKDTDVPVLITGESGTGKEVVARAIHRSSARAKRPFVGVNCGAIPENLLESELFGHVRGAFTGADRERKGLLREAEGGTVLLDEIGEMPQKMQAGLLRVLQERTVRPVGGAAELPVDTRLIFATHRDLAQMVRDGRFREDLYYRIHVIEVPMPPLRERTEDIALLVDHFLGLFAARYKRERRTVSREAVRRLAGYGWPGNVRQLEHVLLNAWVLIEEEVIRPEHLDLPGARPSAFPPRSEPGPIAVGVPPSSRSPATQRKTLSRHRRDEKARIIEALEACNWNRVKAAELSGIPRRTFYRRRRQYGIQ
jgi:serine/threonine-protein kinase PknK